jgi:hypothetical protein
MTKRMDAMEKAAKAQRDAFAKHRDTFTKETTRIARATGIPMTPRQDAGTVDTVRFAVGCAPPRNILEAKFYDMDGDQKIWRAPGMDFQCGIGNGKKRELDEYTFEELTTVKYASFFPLSRANSFILRHSSRFGDHVNASFSEIHENDETPCVPYWMLAEQVQKNTRLLNFVAETVLPFIDSVSGNPDKSMVLEMLETHGEDLELATVPHLRERTTDKKGEKRKPQVCPSVCRLEGKRLTRSSQETNKNVLSAHLLPRAKEMAFEEAAKQARAAKVADMRKIALMQLSQAKAKAAAGVAIAALRSSSPQKNKKSKVLFEASPNNNKKKQQQQPTIELFGTGDYYDDGENDGGFAYKENFYYYDAVTGAKVTLSYEEGEALVQSGKARHSSQNFEGLGDFDGVFNVDGLLA